jgi:hypothetical protein
MFSRCMKGASVPQLIDTQFNLEVENECTGNNVSTCQIKSVFCDPDREKVEDSTRT